jgi:hydrogenase nickel incorporation protein HypA/HybF
MHELSIADAIVQIAIEHAAGRRVRAVEVRIGHLRQVVPSSLTFAFGLLTEGTVLEAAELLIDGVPAVGRCRACTAQTALEAFPLRCGVCGGLDLELLQGEELLVEALVLEALATTGGAVHGDH